MVVKNSCLICGGTVSLWFDKSPYSIARCRECKVAFVSPLPSPKELEEAYNQEKICETLEQKLSSIQYSVTGKTALRRLIELSAFMKKGSRVNILDVACGAGVFVELALKRGYHVEAVEMDIEKADYVEEKYGIKVYRDFFENCIFNEKYDVINMDHFIEHVINPNIVVAKAHSILKTGGIISISTPNLDSVFSRCRGKFSHVICPPLHLWYFTPTALQNLIYQHGLGLVKQGTAGNLRLYDINNFISKKFGRNFLSTIISTGVFPVVTILGEVSHYFNAGLQLEYYAIKR